MALHYLLLITGLALPTVPGYSQWNMPTQMRAQQTLDRLTDADALGRNDLLYGVPLPPGQVVGDYYLDTKWNAASLFLHNHEKMLEGYLVKYDLKSNMLEIKTKNGIKLLDVKRVKSLVWSDSITRRAHYFANAAEFTENGTPLTGLLEVLAEGNWPLMKRTTLYEKQPDYVPAFDVGSRDTKIIKRQTFYMVSGNTLIKIGNKKSLVAQLGDLQQPAEEFIKTNNLDIRREVDLTRLFDFLNARQ